MQRSRGVSKRLNDGVGFLMKKNKVDVIWGAASIDAPGKVTRDRSPIAEAPEGHAGRGDLQAKHIIVATGARPRVLPGIEPDKKLIWTYFEAMVPRANAEVAAGDRLRRDRHRVRLVLSAPWAPT